MNIPGEISCQVVINVLEKRIKGIYGSIVNEVWALMLHFRYVCFFLAAD